MADLVPETRERILEGALAAMGRLGLRRFTMNDVSERSGVSRGTVYRYFPTKDALLEVLAQYEQDRFAGGLVVALSGVAEDELRLETVAEYLLSYLRRHPALTLMIETEPAFVLGFLRRQLPVFHRITEELLGPVMRRAGPVRAGVVTADELDELLLRVVLSVFLVPGDSQAMAGVLEGALDSFVRLAGGRGPRAKAGQPPPTRTPRRRK
ncbi:MAG: TetR/AcrR family transcriptional regulator [Acidimicrobiaceae bacterium]|nr:TetR/AcrR family transcriptional regulator [Acidimicrobiaceae bacterium]